MEWRKYDGISNRQELVDYLNALNNASVYAPNIFISSYGLEKPWYCVFYLHDKEILK